MIGYSIQPNLGAIRGFKIIIVMGGGLILPPPPPPWQPGNETLLGDRVNLEFIDMFQKCCAKHFEVL